MSDPDKLTLEATVTCPWPADDQLILMPACVLEDSGGLSYFAPGHGDRPDFHDRSNYVRYQAPDDRHVIDLPDDI